MTLDKYFFLIDYFDGEAFNVIVEHSAIKLSVILQYNIDHQSIGLFPSFTTHIQ